MLPNLRKLMSWLIRSVTRLKLEKRQSTFFFIKNCHVYVLLVFSFFITTVFFLLFAESVFWLWIWSRERTGEDRRWSRSWYTNVLIRSHAWVYLHVNLMHIFHTIDLLFFYEIPNRCGNYYVYLLMTAQRYHT